MSRYILRDQFSLYEYESARLRIQFSLINRYTISHLADVMCMLIYERVTFKFKFIITALDNQVSERMSKLHEGITKSDVISSECESNNWTLSEHGVRASTDWLREWSTNSWQREACARKRMTRKAFKLDSNVF